MHIQTRDQKELNYYHYGKGQPLIFIHGFGGYQQIWHLQIDFFVRQGFEVWTYDQRDHGASSRDEQLTSMDTLIDDLADFIQRLKIKDPVLIGHSMGASVSYGFLKRHPEIPVKAVVGVDQSPKMLNTPSWHFGYMDITRANYRTVLASHGNVRETLNGVDKRLLWELNPVKDQFPFIRTEHLPLLYDHAKRDWRKTLLATKVPVLLITANQSPYFNPEFAEVLAKENSKIQTQRVDQTGHVIMGEQPMAFNQCLLTYLENL
ncbi:MULTISPECIES: alpha/beta fold hydrolase [Lactobacillaceae]|uniref:Alpha/beta hydrolase n=1 Tax=Limosilactobacillus alvi TaxID=990412 RepID=A0ABS2EMF5_9LACO|nr:MULTISPECIES: alpha/beta hydrolase [Lactobacillaceae]MBM6753420.1 alpha/beta hydrolase [Limosilactobacillus alvi]QLL70692.1 alpha/beta fold hydrolase [Lactobacillus sp. 3B(2020)]